MQLTIILTIQNTLHKLGIIDDDTNTFFFTNQTPKHPIRDKMRHLNAYHTLI